MKAPYTLAAIMVTAVTWSQVYIEHNIPKVLEAGSEREVDVVIHRPAVKGFSQYEINFQPGIAFSGRNTAGGTYKGEDNKARVMWSITPEGQLRLRLAILPATSGKYVLKQRYEYDQGGERRVAYLDDLSLEVRSGYVSVTSEPFSRLNQVVPRDLPATHVDSLTQQLSDPSKAAEHAAQLRRDAQEARKVGRNELKEAELEITESKKALDQATRYKDEQVKKGLLKEAEERLAKAQNNKQIALKIMALADSLEKNAADIERAGLAAGAEKEAKDKKSADEIAELRKLFNNGAPAASSTGGSAQTALYHIQIGAFAQAPSKSSYRKAGNINVINESGLYKVLVGGYENRDDAEKKRLELAGKGFDGFIVRYQGNQRVK